MYQPPHNDVINAPTTELDTNEISLSIRMKADAMYDGNPRCVSAMSEPASVTNKPPGVGEHSPRIKSSVEAVIAVLIPAS